MDNFQNYLVRNLIPGNMNKKIYIKWSLDQGIRVYIETEDGWEFADYYNVVLLLKRGCFGN